MKTPNEAVSSLKQKIGIASIAQRLQNRSEQFVCGSDFWTKIHGNDHADKRVSALFLPEHAVDVTLTSLQSLGLVVRREILWLRRTLIRGSIRGSMDTVHDTSVHIPFLVGRLDRVVCSSISFSPIELKRPPRSMNYWISSRHRKDDQTSFNQN